MAGRTRKKSASADAGRVHLYVGVSLDGYIAGPNHDLSFLEPYGDARAGFDPFSKTIGATIMGRGTYDVAVGQGFAGSFGPAAYVVTTRALPEGAKINAWDGDLEALVADLRERHPRDIWLMGGGKLAMSFAARDLIDIWTIAFLPSVQCFPRPRSSKNDACD